MFNLASRARPYFGAVVLTTVLLTAGGVYSALRMPSGIYPEVTFPRIAVVARVPGLAVPNMEVEVTRPLEEAVTTVTGVAQVRSKTIRGASELSIDFNPGTDMLRAEQLTWNRIGAVRSRLPKDAEMTVDRMTPSVFPILSLVLTGGENAAQLHDYAFFQLAPRIKNIPDVLYANVAGGDVREIEIEARPADLLAAGLSAADLAEQIGKVHVLQPVGRIEREPYSFQIIVNTQGETVRQIEELVVATKNNQTLRVRDVADVRVWHQDRTLSIGFAGKDAVVISVFRSLGGNTVSVSRAVRALLVDQPPPGNIQATVAYDQATFVTTAVNNVRDAILIGGAFSILILLAFLHGWKSLIPTLIGVPLGVGLTWGGVRLAVLVLGRVGLTNWAHALDGAESAILFGGGCIAFLLLALAFGWRATLISSLAIPTTLAITFLFLHWTGESLNLMSLGGLAVAIGLIIDDTVVVIENIARHLSRKPSGPGTGGAAVAQQPDPVDAASGEITGAVVGSSLTTVLVFVPLAFIVGVYGQFFAALSWSLSIAVLVSMVISLTLVPVFAAKFLAGRPMPGEGPIYRFVAHLYELVLGVALRFPRVTLTLAVATVGVGVLLYTGIPDPRALFKKGQTSEPLVRGVQTGLMPAMDEGAFIFDYWAPSGMTLEQTVSLAREVEQILSENPDVEAYLRRTGSENGLFATQISRGDISVLLRPAEDDPVSLLRKPVRPPFDQIEDEMKALGKEAAARKFGPHFTEEQAREEGKAAIRARYRRRPVRQVMDEVEDAVKERFSEHQLKIETVQIMADELNDLSGASRPIEVKVFGKDHKELRELAEKIGELLEKEGKGHGLRDVNSNVREGVPDLQVQVDGVRAARMGLTAEGIRRQLEAIYLGQVATQVRESALRITDVRVRYPDRLRYGTGRFDPSSVLDQLLLVPEGTPAPVPTTPTAFASLEGPARAVPLSAVARLEPRRVPDEQWRENQQPAIFVTSDLNEEEAGLDTAVANIRQQMEKITLPPDYRWELGGHYLRQQEAFRSLLLVMIVAILLIFIMLAFQFRSVVLPLLIFLTQPLSLVSGLFALWLTGTPLNVSSYMGAILLIGLDMKNGILLVEYIQQLRAEGMELRPALLHAGRTRFRPILMTSLAAILGLFPLALGIGPGAQMQQPLAIMVIGGLTANMLFTRMVIPVGYLVLERARPKQTAAAFKKA
jgi:multidrug efflux pump subunit AcrB